MYRRSTDNGASFEDARQLAPVAGGYWWIDPTFIAASDGGVTIAMTYASDDGIPRPCDDAELRRWGDHLYHHRCGHRREPAILGIPVVDLKRVGNRVYLLYTKDLKC